MMAHPDAPWTTHYCTECGAKYTTQMHDTVRVKCPNGHGRMAIEGRDNV